MKIVINRRKYKFISTKGKAAMFKTVVRPVRTYAAETRPGIAKTKNKLWITKMKTL